MLVIHCTIKLHLNDKSLKVTRLHTVILLISNCRRLGILLSTQCLYDCSSENGFPSNDNSERTLHCERHLMSSKLNIKIFLNLVAGKMTNRILNLTNVVLYVSNVVYSLTENMTTISVCLVLKDDISFISE